MPKFIVMITDTNKILMITNNHHIRALVLACESSSMQHILFHDLSSDSIVTVGGVHKFPVIYLHSWFGIIPLHSRIFVNMGFFV